MVEKGDQNASWGGSFISLGIIISAAGAASGWILTTARAAYAAVEAEFLTNDYRSGGTETYYSYDTETGKVKAGVPLDGFTSVEGTNTDPPSTWTIDTSVNGTSNRALGKRVYKKWILVVVNDTGKVRQYMVYFK